MTKKELIDEIADMSKRPGEALLAKSEIGQVLRLLSEAAARAVARGEAFDVPGIVRLGLVERKARIARNPATGAPVEVPAKRAVKAKVAKAFADSVGYYEAGGK